MALFGKKLITCPMCDEGLPARDNKLAHYASHAVKTEKGYAWKCPCGESDGYWEQDYECGAGIADHFSKRHGISMLTSMGG